LLQLDTLSNPENPVLAFTWAYVQRKTRIVQPESLWVVHKWWAQGMPVVMSWHSEKFFICLGGVGFWEQHGEDECYLNIIQTCAIRLWPKVVPSSSPLLSLPSFFLSSAVLHNFVLPQKWMQSDFFSSIKFCMIYMVFSVIKKVSCNFFLDLRIIKFGSFWICLYIDRLRSLR
jgi:hypothetical protein